jgi:hypothetical protein
VCLQCLCIGFLGLSHNHDQFLDPYWHLNDDYTPHVAPSMQAHRAAGFGSINSLIQQGIVNHWGPQGASGISDPPASSFMTTPETPYSLSDEWNSQSGAQDDNPPATLSSHGQVEGAAQSQAVTQGQDTITQAQRREQRVQKKREKDRERKEAERKNDDQAYAMVCKLLEIRSKPKNKRSQQSECLRIHRVGGIERSIVLERVESNEPNYERICELLEISMRPKNTLAQRSECLCIYPR